MRNNDVLYLNTREYLKEVGAAPEFVSDYRGNKQGKVAGCYDHNRRDHRDLQ